MFNKIILVGNLTRDIEIRYTQSGMAIAKTAIATTRKFSSNGEKKEEVCFVDITFFGRSAEVANQWLRKGSKILVEGRLNFEQWQDQNGQKRSKHSVIVETMQMIGSKNDNIGSNAPVVHENIPQSHPQYDNENARTTNQMREQYNKEKQKPSIDAQIPEIDITEDEVPF